MMMAMLEAGGIPCFHQPRADEFNPGGYYEDPQVMFGDLSAVPPGYAAKLVYHLPPVLNADVIVMRRDLDAAVASATRVRTAYGENLPDRDFLQAQLDSIRLWASPRRHTEVWYEDVLRNTPNECLRVARMLGRDLNLAAMAAVVRRDAHPDV